MKIEKISDKMLDLYGIRKEEALTIWKDSLYTFVLKDKIQRAKNLQKQLLQEPMLSRDINRIKRIGDAIVHNNMLLREVN